MDDYIITNIVPMIELANKKKRQNISISVIFCYFLYCKKVAAL